MLVPALVIGSWLATGALAGVAGGRADVETLERAEKEFRQGLEARQSPDQARQHFREAFALFESLCRRGFRSPGLYRNQGNAALLAGDLPAAILAYRRGERLDPGDPTLRENLEYARDQVAYPLGTHTRPNAAAWPPWLPVPADDLLLGVALGWYVLGWSAGTAWLMRRRGALLGWCLAAFVLAGGCGSWWGARQGQAAEERQQPVVVIAADSVPLSTGNGTSYPPHKGLPSVSRGMECRLRFRRADWLQVEFPDGEVGWLPRGSVLIDE